MYFSVKPSRDLVRKESQQERNLKVNQLEVAAILATLGSAVVSANFVYVVLALWALRGVRSALQALTLSLLVTVSNPALVAEVGNVLRWVVMLTAAGRIFFDTFRYGKIPHSLSALFLFSSAVLLISLTSSYATTLSIFKVGVFTIGTSAVILGFHLNRGEHEYWTSWFFTLALTVIVLSIPTYFIEEVGRHKNGRGFQGILQHPQTYGVFLASTLSWLTGALLFREVKRNGLVLFTVAIGWLLLVATLARTAFLSVWLGLLAATIVAVLARRKDWALTLKRLFLGKWSVPFLVVSLMAVAGAAVGFQSTVSEFLLKYDGSALVLERQGYSASTIAGAMYGSRRNMIAQSFDNFEKHPWTGIGFGMASEQEEFLVERANYLNIPVRASIEKGFLPTAVLEEVGIFGAVFLLVFLLSLIRPVISHGSLAALWLILTCVIINMGEVVIFSFGGIGLYNWLMIGLSRTILPPE